MKKLTLSLVLLAGFATTVVSANAQYHHHRYHGCHEWRYHHHHRYCAR